MPKLTVNDLKAIRERTLPTLCLGSCTERAKITLHMGTCGLAAGAGPIMEALKEELATAGATTSGLWSRPAPGCAPRSRTSPSS